MAITVKHKFVSAIPDAGDPNIVQPSNWNDDHELTGTIPVANGGTGASTLTGYVKGNGTAAMTASATVPSTDITGLGTMSTQNSNNINVTGGSISGTTVAGYVPTTTTITAGTGLTGGGDLSANRTLSISNTTVTAAAYGSASKTLTATVNAQGQLTALADTNIAITNTQVSGLGTASTKDAGVANGVATLDSGGKVPVSELPAAVLGALSYQGTWDASTNTPTLTSSVGTKGYYYVVSVAGSTNLNGITDWLVGDWAVYNGTAWQKVDNTDSVTSVNGATGAVVLTTTNIAEGTNLYYTDVRARASNSAGTGISYDNTTGVITNAAPDQTVVLTDGTAIDVTGTYPNFTINNTAPDQTVVLTAGTGISTSGTYPNFTITNTSPSAGGTVTSVGISTSAAALAITNSPITSSGNIGVNFGGISSQYVRGDGALANFPTSQGGGSSVSYYFNGSVNQGTFGGNTYYEMSKTPIFGAGTNFTINADGYIAQFITDAGDPALLSIPAGNWNFELFFSASSGGGSPSFYVELYKYDGTTFTLIASDSGSPEGITNGTAIDLYTTALAVPQTTLAITDRLAIRIYVTHSGRTITLHTEDNNLCQVITTFSTGINALNGLTAQVQYLAVGTSGTDFNISSATDTHTFNLPSASGSNRGALTSADWTTFNNKVTSVTGTSPVVSSGGATPAISLAASYGDTQNPYASKTANFVLAAPNGSAGAPTFRAIVAADIPTLNQNTTGTASNVTGTVAIANGGTGQTTRQAAMDALAGAVTSGQYLRGDGTDVVMSAIQAADVPTLNQNTTGTASNVTGTVAIANGGTGQTTRQAAMDALAGAVTSGQYLRGDGTDVVMSAIQAADVPTLNQDTTGTAAKTNALNSATTVVNVSSSSAPTAGQVLTATSGTAATWQTPASGGVTSFSAGTTGFTPSTGTTGAVTLAGTLAIANGGTGATTAANAFNALSPLTTVGDILYEETGAVGARLPIGTTGQVLTVASGKPAWATAAGSNITTLGLYENSATISANYTIGTGNNAMSAGPITVSTGFTVTVPTGSTWTVV
jgi:hypothetical protein